MYLVSEVHEGVLLFIPLKMEPKKGFLTFSRVVSEGLGDQSYWHVLTSGICGITPPPNLKRSLIVTTFLEDAELRAANFGFLMGPKSSTRKIFQCI